MKAGKLRGKNEEIIYLILIFILVLNIILKVILFFQMYLNIIKAKFKLFIFSNLISFPIFFNLLYQLTNHQNI